MDYIPLLISALSGSVLTGVTSYFIQKRRVQIDEKKDDRSGFQELYQLIKEDNERLRDAEKTNEAEIAKLKRQVDDLQRQVVLMQSAHESLPIPQWLKDLNGVMLSINEPYSRVFKKTRSEYIGKTDFEVWDEATAKKFTANDRQVMKTEQPLYTIEPVNMGSHTEDWYILKYPRYSGSTLVGVGGIAYQKVIVNG